MRKILAILFVLCCGSFAMAGWEEDIAAARADLEVQQDSFEIACWYSDPMPSDIVEVRDAVMAAEMAETISYAAAVGIYNDLDEADGHWASGNSYLESVQINVGWADEALDASAAAYTANNNNLGLEKYQEALDYIWWTNYYNEHAVEEFFDCKEDANLGISAYNNLVDPDLDLLQWPPGS